MSELLVLPSNASSGVFPENKNHTYVIKLPKRLRLRGKNWKIGLRAYSYPFNWRNVTDKSNTFELVVSDAGTATKTVTTHVTPGRYRTPSQLCKEINKQIRAEAQHEKIRLEHDEEARIVSIWWSDNHDVSIRFSSDIAAMLGCKPERRYRKLTPINECSSCPFSRPPDMNAGFHKLYVYCSLCADRVTGDTLVPLLLDIAVPDAETTTRVQVDESVVRPQFVPVRNIDTDEIEVNIRTGFGEAVAFRGGTVSLTVELKSEA